jgi:integrase
MASIRKRTWTTSKGEKRQGFAVDYFDRQGTRQRRQFDTRGEANDFRITVENEIRSGTYRPEAAKVLVRDLAELFLDHCRGRMERGERMTRKNFRVYEGYIRNYICPDPEWHAAKHAAPGSKNPALLGKGLAHYKLAELTVGIVNRFRDDLRATGLSVATTRKIIGMLQVMLAYGISIDLLAFNAARDVEVIATRADEARQIIPPDPDVMRQLIDLADERFRVILMFAASTGVRAGELHAFRWKHVDFQRRELRVETRVDNFRTEDVPKTRAGLRTIPLGEALVRALLGWRQKTHYPQSADLIFPNFRGEYWNHDAMVKSKWRPLFKRLAAEWKKQMRNEQPEFFNWHALRHFAISCWIDAGLQPKTVQTFAGHSSLQVTMDRYGHLFRSDSHAAAMDAIAANIQSSRKPTVPEHAHRNWADFVP